MTIWSAEIKEIERLNNSIKGHSPDLEKELERLIKTDDENIVLVYSRRCLEVIITDLCECELKRPRKTEPLQGIIDKLNREEKIPSHIFASMQSLNSLSTFGSHPKEFDPRQVKPVLNNLTTIIEWYLKYKDTKYLSKVKPDIESQVDAKEFNRKSNRKKIILGSGLLLLVTIVILLLFVFNIIGGKTGKKQLEKSIAVLPFVNDSQDEENTYFINGIMEEVLLNLQLIKDLKVPGRTSVEQYRNPTKSIPEIAKELDVNYVVEGSGQKYGNTFKLRIQLLDGAKGWHLWGESYEQTIERTEDIFDIQNQIAQSIAAELKAIITPEEKQIIEKNLTSNLTAYDFFLRGRDEYIRYKSDNENTGALERAEKFYHQALEYDPTYAQAFTGLAMVYWDKHYWDTYFTSTENFLDSVLILSDIALSYDDQFAEAYSLKGDYYRENANYNQALEEYEKALNINPNYWQAYAGEGELYFNVREPLKAFENLHMAVKLNHDQELPSSIISLADQYCYSGFFDKAQYYYDKALKLNSDSVSYLQNLAVIEMLRENYLKAFEYEERAYAMDTNNVNTFYLLAELYEKQNQYRAALKYCRKYVERLEALKIISIRDAHRIGYCYLENGFTKEAEYYFDLQKKYCEESIKLNRGYATDAGAYYDLATIYAVKGEKEKAYENLQLFNNKIGEFIIYGWLWYFKNDLLLDSIRNEPQFQEIFREIEGKYKRTYQEVEKWLEEQGLL